MNSNAVLKTVHPWKRFVFIDTEFTSIDDPKLISLALVAEGGMEFYAEAASYDLDTCSDFVRINVLPLLGQFPDRILSSDALFIQLRDWMAAVKALGPRPVLCYDHSIDITLLYQILGKRPVGWQALNIAQRIDPITKQACFDKYGGRHHSLNDARANQKSFK